MINKTIFGKAQEKNMKILKQYVPVVDRVHGENHPEFHEVRKCFDAILEKTKMTSTAKPELTGEFEKLREITKNYKVPDDVCESYEAVYTMLAELDEAYHTGLKA